MAQPKKKWMAGAVRHPGSFKAWLVKHGHMKKGGKVGPSQIAAGRAAKSGAIRRKAALAQTFAHYRGNPGVDLRTGPLDMGAEMGLLGGQNPLGPGQGLSMDEASSLIGARRQMRGVRRAGLLNQPVRGVGAAGTMMPRGGRQGLNRGALRMSGMM
jgi:hypothetical protein